MADTIRRVYEIDAKIASTAMQSLREIQRNLRETESAARSVSSASKAVSKDVEETGSAFSHLRFNNTGARRELLVLAHELSQGNYKAFAGSLLVMGERIDATRLILSAAGLSAIAFAAAVTVITIAIVKGAFEQDKYNKSLVLTGNAAGQTIDSITAMSRTIAGATHGTAGGVSELARALVATGEVGPRAFAPMLEAMVRVKKLTGETADEIAAKFKNFADDPTKSALEFNKQLNFLDSALLSQIRRLQELGDKQGAAVLAADAITAALKDRQLPALGLLQIGYEAFGRGLDRIAHFFVAIGQETTFEAKLDSLYKKLGDLQARANNPTFLEKLNKLLGGSAGAENEEAQEAARRDIGDVIRAKTERDNKARIDAETALIKREAVIADQELYILDKQTKGYTRKQLALEALAKSEAAIVRDRRRTDPTFEIDPKVHAARVAEIERQNRTQADKSLDNAITTTLRTLGQEHVALREEIKQYEEYGKKVTNATRAKIDFRLASGDLKGAGVVTAKKITTAADLVDADKLELAQVKAEATADRRIAQLKTEAEAHALNAREIQIAVELGKLETDGLVKGTPAYEKRAVLIRDYTNAIHDNALARKLAANEAATSDEARAIVDEIDLIGKSTLERQKFVATLRLQRQVTKELTANPDKRDEILASSTRQVQVLTAAIDEAYAASRRFETGAANAFAKFYEETADGAKFANDVITGGLKQVEDMFLNFAKTGKLNFKDLFTFMADEFLRQSIRMTTSGIMKEGQEGLTAGLKGLASVFGINFGDSKAKGASAIGSTGTDAAAMASMATASSTAAASLGLLDGALISADVGMTSLTLAAEAAAGALLNVAISGKGGAAGGAVTDAIGSVDWSTVWGGALGGIMSSRGMLALNTYGGGGIARANSPQMAIFGEGRSNEAYVPLPDGRSIPVTMKSTGPSDSGAPLNVTIENHNTSDVSVKRQKNSFGKDELRVVIKAAKQELLDDIYGGGEFDKAMTDKYGVDRAGGTPRSGR